MTAPNKQQNNESKPRERRAKPGLLQIIGSTFAAALGVQSNKNRERDFRGGNLKVYIVSGILFTLAFIGGLVALVNYLLAAH
ncbi:DUF2970 domain-containing protein [Gilvimarinus sp. SDUM040013]|uniref:DUF2970 domain-containing protein n=1 Tax=Gilvimarinus gilvus TaxID=3058038 RepID=A0ABU4RU07_9GAMM|nr:DUF2970 domain-containing protein [Gilvimarinus sp. SDUM040013]MDO3384994.1 DUF2970 domain-containing protein [Gilvimarinus sp. SDUM040013]MDX6848369.1 DUF2970 domain-containing protein [Gilvimarinus sp. SDUM040013]